MEAAAPLPAGGTPEPAPSVDQELDAVMIKQLSWKASTCTNVARVIVAHYLNDRIAYSDTVKLDFVPGCDRNVIGTTWRRLVMLGILKPMGNFKRSEAAGRKGGKVFKYRLASEKLALAFLARNGGRVVGLEPRQPELLPETV